MTKQFTVSTTCPRCGHTATVSHGETAMRETFGNDPTISVLCPKCQANFEQPMELACAEWDDFCQEIPLPADV